MNKNILIVICLSTAVVAASIAAYLVSENRASEAASKARAAESEEAAANAKRKAAEAEAAAKADERRAAESKARAEASRQEAEKTAHERAKVEARTAEENRKAAEAESATARAEAETAKENSAAAKAQATQAKAEKAKAIEDAKAEQAKADAEAARLASKRLEADRIISEAKLLELRKIDFEAVQQSLIEWKLDLEERERALQPEKTIADLDWAGGNEDTVIDSSGRVVKQTKEAYDPEKDTTLPAGTRALTRQQRLVREAESNHCAAVRAKVVAPLEKLYVEALRQNRVIDSEFYKKTLKSLYPDWEFKVENE